MLQNSSKISHYLSNFEGIFLVKNKLFTMQKISIQSVFVSIQFKIDQIVCA
jgi:hypothetical protein